MPQEIEGGTLLDAERIRNGIVRMFKVNFSLAEGGKGSRYY